MEEFASLIQDYNPIHHRNITRSDHPTTDGNSTGTIVPGIMVASMFSSVFATLVPGCIYKKQSLQFFNPVFADSDTVVARIEVKRTRNTFTKGGNRSDGRGGVLVECDTSVSKVSSPSLSTSSSVEVSRQKVIQGSALVWLPQSGSI